MIEIHGYEKCFSFSFTLVVESNTVKIDCECVGFDVPNGEYLVASQTHLIGVHI